MHYLGCRRFRIGGHLLLQRYGRGQFSESQLLLIHIHFTLASFNLLTIAVVVDLWRAFPPRFVRRRWTLLQRSGIACFGGIRRDGRYCCGGTK